MRKRQEATAGTLPGYMPESRAKRFLNRVFGVRRRLSVSEEGNMLLLGRSRREISTMTPKELEELANLTADQSETLLGS